MNDQNEKTKKEHLTELEERMGMNDNLPDLDAIEKKMNELEDNGDQEEPMTIERKVNMLSKIFPLAIGDQVKNCVDEEGVIDLVGLDSRGVIYLVKYKGGITIWETYLTKIPKHLTSKINAKDPAIKTDIPNTNNAKYTGQHRTD